MATSWCRSAEPTAPAWPSTTTRTGSAQQLADAYSGIVDAYGLNRIDFDIEERRCIDGSSALNAQALKLFQQSHPDVEVWYTLPVLPAGLTADGVNVVDQALKAGEARRHQRRGHGLRRFGGPAGGSDHGHLRDSGGWSTYNQMTLFGKYGQTFDWRQIGDPDDRHERRRVRGVHGGRR